MAHIIRCTGFEEVYGVGADAFIASLFLTLIGDLCYNSLA